MKIINSLQNEIIKDLKKQKDKNRFLLFLDNPKSIEEAIKAKVNLKYLLVEESKKELINQFEKVGGNAEILVVNESIIKVFTEVKTPQGIIAIFEMKPREFELPEKNFLVLDNVQDAGNVGTLIRSALGANFENIYLLNCASITNIKTVRSSMGAIFKVKIFEMGKQEFLNQTKNIKLPMYSAQMDGQNIYKNPPKIPCGIILGNEGKGVSQELRAVASGTISIPQNEQLESLNVSVAGSIIMFQLEFNC